MPYFGLVQARPWFRSWLMVNKIDRPNTTPTVRAICKFAVYFSVFRHFSRFSLVYDGHRRYCIISRNLDPLDCAMADLKRSKLCVISAVIFSWVWHLCYLPCVSVFFWLISIARYVFKSSSICFLGQKYDRVYCECAVTCIINCDAGPGYLVLLELFASTVEKFLSRVSYLTSDPTFFYWHVVA